MSKPVSFGLIIKEARLVKGYTQEQVASFVSINISGFSKIENDSYDYFLKESTIEKIANYLDINAEELMFLNGQIPSVYQNLVQCNYQFLAEVFFRIRLDPKYAQKLFERINI